MIDKYAGIPDWLTHLLEIMLLKLKAGQEGFSEASPTGGDNQVTTLANVDIGQLVSSTHFLGRTPSTQGTTTAQYSPPNESIFGAFPIQFFAVPPEPPPLPLAEIETEEANSTSGVVP